MFYWKVWWFEGVLRFEGFSSVGVVFTRMAGFFAGGTREWWPLGFAGGLLLRTVHCYVWWVPEDLGFCGLPSASFLGVYFWVDGV